MKKLFLLCLFVLFSKLYAASFDYLNIPLNISNFYNTSSIVSDGVYSSPAILADAKNHVTGFNYVNWFEDINIGSFYYLQALENGAFALSFEGVDYGTINETTEDNPYGTGNVLSATDYVGSIMYAKKIKKINVGSRFSYLYSRYSNYSSSALKVDIGASIDIENYSWAFNLFNIGYMFDSYVRDGNIYNLPYKVSLAWGNKSSRRRAVFEVSANYDSYSDLYYNFNWIYKFNSVIWLNSALNFNFDDLSYILSIASSNGDYVRFDTKILAIGLNIYYKKISFAPLILINTIAIGPTYHMGLNYEF